MGGLEVGNLQRKLLFITRADKLKNLTSSDDAVRPLPLQALGLSLLMRHLQTSNHLSPGFRSRGLWLL